MRDDLLPGLTRVSLALMEHLNTIQSWTVARQIREGRWEDLANNRISPSDYDDDEGDVFCRDYQAVEFLRKSPLLPLNPAGRREKALETFEESEMACARTNRGIKALQFCRDSVSLSEQVRPHLEILSKARKIAGRILGPVPDRLSCRFGPGTTFELKDSTYSTVLDKMSKEPTATSLCLPLFEWEFYSSKWGQWSVTEGRPLPSIAKGNRFSTVPKDATKDRGICIEPVGNLWIQLGIGSHMKRRLAAVGLEVGDNPDKNLAPDVWRCSKYRDGQAVHREWARRGSITGDLATIDLSNASDTVAYELVREVLPPDWFQVLDAARSPYTLLPGGRWVKLEKFSSMGNGATFELETLIFAALIAAATGLKVGDEFKVYGDDIIVPTAHSALVLEVLKEFGFTPNDRKTFAHGPFRESCGGDFFSGQDVRPSYADSLMETPLDWIVLHNQLKQRWPDAIFLHQMCIAQIPLQFRKFGPAYLGDMVLHGPYEPRCLPCGTKTVQVVVPQTPKVALERWSSDLHMLAVLSGVCEGQVTTRRPDGRIRKTVLLDRVGVRGEPTGFRITTACVS